MLNTSPDPKAHTTGEALRAAPMDEELARFEEHVRPLAEAGRGTLRSAFAYLRAIETWGPPRQAVAFRRLGKEDRMAGREPSASPLPLPPAYGKPTRPMAWSDADDLLTESRVYWIASVRPDGRPHIVPSDGIWLDDTLYFGGSPDTVHMRNVRATGRAVAHVGDGLAAAVIVEGNVTDETPTPDVAARLAVANNTKYADYGMTMQPEDYVRTGVTALRARRVLAWTRYPENATRFEFG